MKLQFGTSAYRRDKAGLPEVEVVNMLAETAPTASGGVTLIARPGLETTTTLGAGPIVGLFSAEGVFSADRFTVSGSAFFRAETAVGTVIGSGPAGFAASATQVLVTRGGVAGIYDGTFADVSFPDGAGVVALAFLAGLFVAIRVDTHRFYWSAVLDGGSWNGLDYASAESSPDRLLDIVIVGDEMCLLGDASIEFWQPTGSSDTPFIRSQGRLYRKGVIATGCAKAMDNSLFWVAPDFIVYRGGQVPERVSDNGIEERIAASAAVSAAVIEWQGHKLFCVRLDSGTFAYDASTGQWSRFKSFGLDDWRVLSATTVAGLPVLGDSETGKIFSFSGEDDDGEARECLWTALLPIVDVPVPVGNILIEANVGRTQLVSGQGSDPVVEMRSSRDAAATWGDYRSATLGRIGEYRRRSVWRRCGLFDAPVGVFGFRVTDAVPLRVSGVRVNEPLGGRGR